MKALLGTVGIGAIEGVQHLPAPNVTMEIVKVVVQVILGVATLFKMFKKPKEVISNQNQQ
ncbi:hypothetical protein [Flavobacterium hydatis]|jgi:hypothetical protein|uniref:Uncharacterized protein n=1 Tax=Flavobacterium hydatis TaxID=991 RepID=A0A086AEG9_FLAHY|nr:hypothetical protein [Flavobacterium hydatis]KFF15083.1 hypothetical protein IW20_15605 [Flavobacterium hydatis]